ERIRTESKRAERLRDTAGHGLERVTVEQSVFTCFVEAATVHDLKRDVAALPRRGYSHQTPVVRQVQAGFADPHAIHVVVLDLEPQLALEQRVRQLELTDHQRDTGSEHIRELDIRILETRDLTALGHEEVQVVADVVRDRHAGQQLDTERRLEIAARIT